MKSQFEITFILISDVPTSKTRQSKLCEIVIKRYERGKKLRLEIFCGKFLWNIFDLMENVC